jgi:DNA polymerase III epsilon subunit-like protein
LNREQFDAGILTAWTDQYGPFPDDYVCVDLESTGVTPQDKIVQIGWCTVKDRKPVLSHAIVIDWTTDHATDAKWLAKTLANTRAKMAEKGKQYPWTVDLLRSRGKKPRDAVATFANACKPYTTYSTHYGWAFDYPRLGKLMHECGLAFSPDQDRMLDTGLLTKACLTRTPPRPDETVAAYMRRVDSVRAAPRHNIEACIALYDLKTSGAGSKNTHEGAYDAWLVALMTEKLRHLEQVERSRKC